SDIKHRPSTPSSITSPSLHDALPIYDGGADLHRAGARLAVHMAGNAHQTAHRLEDRIIAGARRVRPGLAEAGHRAIDDAGIVGADRKSTRLNSSHVAISSAVLCLDII